MVDQRTQARIERIKVDPQFGCGGRHYGNGSADCPGYLHHHHDWFCEPPTINEWYAAGQVGEPRWSSRA